MTREFWLPCALLALLALSVTSSPSVSLASDSEQLLRIGQVIALDRQKLSELEVDVSQRQEHFDWLATRLEPVEAELAGKRALLAELGESGDPTERSDLEAEISRLEVEQELIQNQLDIAFSSLTMVREQISSLGKKIEREQRALDTLRGLTPPGPVVPPTADAPVGTPATAPQIGVPSMPGVPLASTAEPRAVPQATPHATPMPTVETTAQIEALRELDRRQREAQTAQLALVEFVKRKRSLEQQISMEARLLQTARSSVENLTRTLETARTDLEVASAAGASESDQQALHESFSLVEGLLAQSRREVEERTAYLVSLEQRLERLAEEEASVSAEAETAREAVAQARSRMRWLQSPVHPENILRWGRERGPRILFLVVVLIALVTLLRVTIRQLVQLAIRRKRAKDSRTDRAATLALSFRSAASILIFVVGLFLVLEEAGIDVKTVLGGAAILGVAVAFGAQNLMRDYFTGFLLLLENQFELGDVITISGITGTVESVNMRVTMLRDLEGRVHFVPNGEIKSVTNRTYQWGRAVVEIPIRYDESVDRVMETLSEVAREMREDLDYSERITEDPVMLGVDAFTEYGVVIKFMLKTLPEEMFVVRRELLRRVKKKFDERGIEISVPHRIFVERDAAEAAGPKPAP